LEETTCRPGTTDGAGDEQRGEGRCTGDLFDGAERVRQSFFVARDPGHAIYCCKESCDSREFGGPEVDVGFETGGFCWMEEGALKGIYGGMGRGDDGGDGF
jgi:hypothetical protein